MFLIIAHHNDAEAQWLYDVLRTKHPAQATLLFPEALGVDYSISLYLSNSGRHEPVIRLFDSGLCLKGDDIAYTLNRLSFIDPIVWQYAEQKEKAYVTNEFNAFFPAFLHALPCPLSNPIPNGSLYAGRNFGRQLAGNLRQQGIEIHPLMPEPSGRVFEFLRNTPPSQLWRLMYFEGMIILPQDQESAAEQSQIEACLLQYEHPETIELIFLKEKDRLVFLQASRIPALSLYNQRLVDAFTHLMKKTEQHDTPDGYTQRTSLPAAC